MVVQSATGADSGNLDWASFNTMAYKGKKAQIQIVDANPGRWGHVLADQFTTADKPALNTTQRAPWLDYGSDFYAANTWTDALGGRRVMIAWMNNWNYGPAYRRRDRLLNALATSKMSMTRHDRRSAGGREGPRRRFAAPRQLSSSIRTEFHRFPNAAPEWSGPLRGAAGRAAIAWVGELVNEERKAGGLGGVSANGFEPAEPRAGPGRLSEGLPPALERPIFRPERFPRRLMSEDRARAARHLR